MSCPWSSHSHTKTTTPSYGHISDYGNRCLFGLRMGWVSASAHWTNFSRSHLTRYAFNYPSDTPGIRQTAAFEPLWGPPNLEQELSSFLQPLMISVDTLIDILQGSIVSFRVCSAAKIRSAEVSVKFTTATVVPLLSFCVIKRHYCMVIACILNLDKFFSLEAARSYLLFLVHFSVRFAFLEHKLY